MAKPDTVRIPLASIRIDGGTQPRAEINEQYVRELTEFLQEGGTLPAVDVYFDGADYWLGDGFHRWHSHKSAGIVDLECVVHQGSRRDAVLFSCGVNAGHGLRRTNSDKRKAVMTLLKDPEWVKWSDRKIADVCQVSHEFIRRIRESICQPLTDSTSQTTRTVERQGATYQQNTTNIGRKQAAPVAVAEPVAEPDDEPTEPTPQPERAGPSNHQALCQQRIGGMVEQLRIVMNHANKSRLANHIGTAATTEIIELVKAAGFPATKLSDMRATAITVRDLAANMADALDACWREARNG